MKQIKCPLLRGQRERVCSALLLRRDSLISVGLLAVAIYSSSLLVHDKAIGAEVSREATASRTWSLPLSGVLHAKTTIRMETEAKAICDHGTAAASDDTGFRAYMEYFGPPNQRIVQTPLHSHSVAEVPHAKGEAWADFTPNAQINGNRITVTGTSHVKAVASAQAEPPGGGGSFAFARAKVYDDPIVFGKDAYVAFDGDNVNAFPLLFDGSHGYVEHTFELLDPTIVSPGPSGPEPTFGWINKLTFSEYVLAGSDDNPIDPESGTLFWSLDIVKTSSGEASVEWTLGPDTSDFAFTWSRTEAEIEADVLSYILGGIDLEIGTGRITQMADPASASNFTVVGVNNDEDWAVAKPQIIPDSSSTLLLLSMSTLGMLGYAWRRRDRV